MPVRSSVPESHRFCDKASSGSMETRRSLLMVAVFCKIVPPEHHTVCVHGWLCTEVFVLCGIEGFYGFPIDCFLFVVYLGLFCVLSHFE